MELYHASKQIVQYPEVRKAKYTKDFSWGFYCTNNIQQAIRWVNRGAGDPVINYYEYEPNDSLKILKFPEMQMIQYGIMSMIFLLDELVGNNFGY